MLLVYKISFCIFSSPVRTVTVCTLNIQCTSCKNGLYAICVHGRSQSAGICTIRWGPSLFVYSTVFTDSVSRWWTWSDCTYTLSYQDPVVQSIVSLTSSLVVKMITVLVSTISNSQVFFWKNVSSFCICKCYSHFFSKNVRIYAIFNDRSFKDTLTNDMFSFE